MQNNGLRTTQIPSADNIDQLLGNHDGSSVLISIASLIQVILGRIGPSYASTVELNGDLDWGDGAIASVHGDDNRALNGVYIKDGASGSGGWTRIGDLPLSPPTLALLNSKADQGELDAAVDLFTAGNAGLTPKGGWDASIGVFPAASDMGDFYIVTTAGTVNSEPFQPGDWLISLVDNASTSVFASNWARGDYSRVLPRTYNSVAHMGASAFLTDGQYVPVAPGTNGEVEHYRIDFGSTATADGSLIVDLANFPGRAISTRTEMADFAELVADNRQHPVGTILSVVNVGEYEVVTSNGDFSGAANELDVVYQDYLRPEQFGGRDAFHVFRAAQIVSQRMYGVVKFGVARYKSAWDGTYFTQPGIMDLPNVSFVGSKEPSYNADYTALENGSIIEGSVFFAANNVAFEKLGIDVGSAYCSANNGGVPKEGLIGIDRKNGGVTGFSAGDPEKRGVSITDVKILASGTNSNVHALLLENYRDWKVRNISTVLGGAGQVFKCHHGSLDGSYAMGHAKYCILQKAEEYSDAGHNTYDNMIFEALANKTPYWSDPGVVYDTSGFFIQAANANSTHTKVGSIVAIGMKVGVTVQGLGVWKVTDVVFTGGIISRALGNAIFCTGLHERIHFFDYAIDLCRYGPLFQKDGVDCSINNVRVDGAFIAFDNNSTNLLISSCSSRNAGNSHLRQTNAAGSTASLVLQGGFATSGTGLKFNVGATAVQGLYMAEKVAVPAANNSPGFPGQWANDFLWHYIYTGTGASNNHTWRRVALETF